MARPAGVQVLRTKVLFITTAHRVGGWLAKALTTEGPGELRLDEVSGAVAGLSRLRDEVFDAVLVSHVPGELDALAFLHAARTGGSEEPVIVLGVQSEQELSAAAFEASSDPPEAPPLHATSAKAARRTADRMVLFSVMVPSWESSVAPRPDRATTTHAPRGAETAVGDSNPGVRVLPPRAGRAHGPDREARRRVRTTLPARTEARPRLRGTRRSWPRSPERS